MFLFDVNVIHIHGGTINHTVTFDANGGHPTPPTQTVRDGGLVTRPDDPELELMRLVGWFLDREGKGSPWNFATDRVTSDITLFAIWEWASTVVVRYMIDADGSEYFISTVGGGSNYILKSCAEVGFFRDNLIVESWNTRPDGFGLRHDVGETIQPTDTTTLYAQWRPVRIGGSRAAPVDEAAENLEPDEDASPPEEYRGDDIDENANEPPPGEDADTTEANEDAGEPEEIDGAGLADANEDADNPGAGGDAGPADDAGAGEDAWGLEAGGSTGSTEANEDARNTEPEDAAAEEDQG